MDISLFIIVAILVLATISIPLIAITIQLLRYLKIKIQLSNQELVRRKNNSD
jgi:uncharacterized membrane protein YdbT with pleckstrin-like domain